MVNIAVVLFPQIYIFYGTRSNAEFVIHNGFFYQENAHDQVKIKLGISKSERLYAMKAEVLGRAGIPVYVPLCSPQLFPSSVTAPLVLQQSAPPHVYTGCDRTLKTKSRAILPLCSDTVSCLLSHSRE